MKTALSVIVLLALTSNFGFGQSKKELRLTVSRLQSDSTAFDKKISENEILISNLNSELPKLKD